MKKIYCCLLIISFALLIFCGYNYSKYKNVKSSNLKINDEFKNYKDEETKKKNEKKELNENYEKLKEEKKTKIAEYEKWEKWTKEIEEKMQ